ncbi:hypothetical protein LTR36_005643 [Oleoguttula mirabilis]|uniref:Uncharacterized protein n=1 Tax=Oleoguttula mirabilis TaxID=1507867 RepID=A0AAV9JE38_9PEZI|nr:hypothetical protein LTR36_005643 [Oleoguttula mirabilis]
MAFALITGALSFAIEIAGEKLDSAKDRLDDRYDLVKASVHGKKQVLSSNLKDCAGFTKHHDWFPAWHAAAKAANARRKKMRREAKAADEQAEMDEDYAAEWLLYEYPGGQRTVVPEH